ncbi:MAG: SDR family NAD(P)-dependent oxidoreductase [Candidatus Nanopelagicales bacterium]|nr:SDR family NAD(P)-dependent oxidoreductase [Candidatus Nanopelagicales bacterium]
MSESHGERKALILGASSDIGLAMTRKYLDAGFRVTGHFHRNPEALRSLSLSHPGLDLIELDLSDLNSVQSAAQDPAITNCDALVCLAAFAAPMSLESIDIDLLHQTMNVGALANYVLLSALGPKMAKRGWGRIVIGSSIGVKFGGGVDSFAYALANHACEFIPRLARDWAANNVLSNVVRIGVTDTKMHSAFSSRNLQERKSLIPINRAADVSEIVDYLFWLGSEQNTYVTGQVNAISGGE